jgi:hypothetical protein
MSEKTFPEGHSVSGKVGLRRYLSARIDEACALRPDSGDRPSSRRGEHA